MKSGNFLRYLLAAAILAFCVTGSAASAWTNNMSFESYSVGSAGAGNCDGRGDGLCDPGSRQTVVSSPVSGGNRSLRMTVAGGAFDQPQFGFRLNDNVYDNGEFWTRYFFYPEAGWDWTGNPMVKTLRLHQRKADHSHAGYVTLYIGYPGNQGYPGCSAEPNDNSYIGLNNEAMGSITYCQNRNIEQYDYMTPGRWHAIEIYLKVSSSGKGIVRLWHDGELISEYLNQTNIPSGGYFHKGDANTHINHFIGYWNGAAPKTQNFYLDDFIITTDTPSARDAQGNPMVGSGSFPPPAKKGDLNNSGKVDVTDLGILLSNWGATSKPASDLNQDGRVDVTDLGLLLGNWG